MSAPQSERGVLIMAPTNPQHPDGRSDDPDRSSSWPSKDEPVAPRRRRYTCPKRTQPNRPKRISKKAINGGRCDYIGPDGNICSHWQAPGSDACWCHFDAYNALTGVEMPYPRATKTRSGGWKKKPTVLP